MTKKVVVNSSGRRFGVDPERPILQDRVEPTMTAEKYATVIKNKFKLSQIRAARFFGMSDRQGQRVASGEVEVPVPVEYVITMMLKHGYMPGDLNKDFVNASD